MESIEGFILSRHWRDKVTQERGRQATARVIQKNASGLQLEYWLKTPKGPLRVIVSGERSVFFVAQSDADKCCRLIETNSSISKNDWSSKELNLKNFNHESVTAFYFAEQRDLYKVRDLLSRNSVVLHEADIRPSDRFLMERFITGSMEVYGNIANQDGFFDVHNPRVKSSNYIPSLTIASLDIETSMQGDLLYSIATSVVRYDPNNRETKTIQEIVFMVGDEPLEENSHVVLCVSEFQLFSQFLLWFHTIDPDIIIGWSVVNFDLRFLQRKADALKIPFNLGRGKSLLEWRQSRDDDEYFTLKIPGRAVLDGIDTLKSATYTFESFSLQSVANQLLDRGKLIHDVDNRGGEITRLFREDKQALAAYNLEDCRLVWDIFAHTHLIDFAIQRAQMTGLAIDRFGGSVASFDNRYLPKLHRAGYVAPELQDDPPGVGSPGGYVMDSIPGLYKNVLVLDFKSLYPSIIRSFKIDPLGLAVSIDVGEDIGWTKEQSEVNDATKVPGFNGAVFDKSISILPDLIGELWLQRDNAKAENNAASSQAIKILMNSFYGVLGTPGCRFFDPRLPSSITLRGHHILYQTRALVEEKGFKVIYGDTDSLFVWLKDTDENTPTEKLFEYGERLALELNLWWKETLDSEYGLTSYLELEFETCFLKFVMPTIRGAETGSKKRYAGLKARQNNNEDERLIFKGLETVRTDWTPLAREFQKELYRRIFYDEPYEDFVRKIVKEIQQGERDKQLVYRKRIRRKLQDYKKNVPPHVQAARLADTHRLKQGLAPEYERGGWIQYVLTVNGPEPIDYQETPLDYDLYIERQIAPVVDGITHFLGTSFDEIAGHQLGLF